MARATLAVWLYGTRIATLTDHGRSMRLAFDATAEERFGAGSPVLSVSMPIDSQRRPNGQRVRAFFGGLLPEGEARDTISARFGARRGDNFGLLAAIGRDCAGAVVVQAEDAPAPGEEGSAVEPLGAAALEHALAEIKDRPLGAGDDVRVSLAGMQEKLLLARTPGGEWARPTAGAPSTHILKPQDMRLRSYAASEAFCLRIARALELTTVEADVLEIGGRPIVVVSRYDRVSTPRGIERIHQEDATQALAIDMSSGGSKYEALGGPSLRAVAAILSAYAPQGDLLKLLALTTLNVAVGNADAHAKNISFLHRVDGSTELAPAYDITPTTFYRQIPTSTGPRDMTADLAMLVNGKRSIHAVTADDLAREAATWGLGDRRSREVVRETLEGIERAAGEASKVTGIPDAMLGFVADRTRALVEGHPANHFEQRHAGRRVSRGPARTEQDAALRAGGGSLDVDELLLARSGPTPHGRPPASEPERRGGPPGTGTSSRGACGVWMPVSKARCILPRGHPSSQHHRSV
ncbi:MAG: HipA domain-containing protein [Acidimicrobiales bacterium]